MKNFRNLRSFEMGQEEQAEDIIIDESPRGEPEMNHQRESINNEICIIFDEDDANKQSEQNEIMVQSLPNHRFTNEASPQPKVQDENLDNSNCMHRYDQKFFKQMERTRQGIPTLTAKARKTIINDIIHQQGQPHSNEREIMYDGRVSYQPEDRQQNTKNQMNAQLLDELQHIEMHQQYRFQLEKFIILFSKDYKEAFQYLFDNNIIPDDNRKIAQILLTTEGLNKDALNKFFGSPKQKNQDIFREYCSLLDFRGLTFVKALRLLLSRFRMAGEAQQVDRMVLIFADVYYQQNHQHDHENQIIDEAANPNAVSSKDDLYVLAYSLIMLSTDAASTKIAAKNKMTKQQFVKNNKDIFTNLPISYLEEVYDDITSQPFQTTIDYVEQIYNRMSMCHEKLQGDTMKKALNLAFVLMKGSNLIKYGRQGEPKPRKMFLSQDERRICWRAIDKEEPARYINVADVYDLALGQNTTDVMKKHLIPIEFDQFCFSIITHYRTLDVKVNDLEIKSSWVNYLRAIIIQRRELESRKAQQNLKREENKMKREEIWRQDIYPRWEFHWDYKKNRPQNFQRYHSVRKEEVIQKQRQKANRGPSILESFCSCLKNTIPIGHRQSNPNVMQTENASQINQYQDMPFQGKNHSLLLMILWKLGVPDWARKTLWPITIGNRLEFTETLYSIYMKQVEAAPLSQNEWVRQAFGKIDEDLIMLKSKFRYLEDNPQKYQSLQNILRAFIFYRPDFGYIRGMGNLAAVLVLYLTEYEAFQSFINLIHSHHFLPLFKGDMREIEWRIRFFDENFNKILPLVYSHFKALDISSEIFLIPWFITLFSNILLNDMLARLWDNFLLEGEIYIFRASIAYIKYFMLELKMSPFDEVIEILKTHPPEINEDYFFILTDEIPIKEEEYKRFIEMQRVAVLNTQIHLAMLQE